MLLETGNTHVEWSKTEIKGGFTILATSHSEHHESASPDIINKLNGNGIGITSHIHDHWNGTPISGANQPSKKLGDTDFARSLLARPLNQGATFQMYDAGRDSYTNYNGSGEIH
jgi:hypothetical protein